MAENIKQAHVETASQPLSIAQSIASVVKTLEEKQKKLAETSAREYQLGQIAALITAKVEINSQIVPAFEAAVKEIEKTDNYPIDIFTEPSVEEVRKITDAVVKLGLTPDRYAAFLARIGQATNKKEVLKILGAKE